MTDPAAAVSADPNTDATLDAQALANLRLLDPSGQGLLARILDTYRSSLARLLLQLDAAQARADAAAMRLAVHTLRSSSAAVGALALSALCAQAEQALREGRLDGLDAHLEGLRSEAARVDRAVQQLLA